MNLQELEKLLADYYEGATGSNDDKRLLFLLESPDLPDRYWPDRDVVLSLMKEVEIPEPGPGFEDSIMKAIDDEILERRIRTSRRWVYSVTTAAAALVILVTSYLLMSRQSAYVDTYDDPVLAYAEAKRLLLDVSQNLNMGQEEIASMAVIDRTLGDLGSFSAATRAAEEQLDKVRYFDRGVDLLKKSGINK